VEIKLIYISEKFLFAIFKPNFNHIETRINRQFHVSQPVERIELIATAGPTNPIVFTSLYTRIGGIACCAS
jgi:hypothetical protein